MLKFLRKYNKYILVVGCCVLMVVFLLPNLNSFVRSDPSTLPVGTLADGTEFTVADQRNAQAELGLLARLSPYLVQGIDRDPLRWTLMLHEAQAIGLHASDFQVDQELIRAQVDPADLKKIANQAGVRQEHIRQAMRRWTVVQRYYRAMYGLGEDQAPRISAPFLERFMFDRFSTLRVNLLLVPATLYEGQAPDPSDEQVQQLYDQHRSNLAGQSEPYGFGYKLPDRVWIEYLHVPFDPVRETLAIEEAEALGYYDEHLERFKPSEPPEAPPKPYEDVRDRVIQQLTDDKARDKCRDMIRAAQHHLIEAHQHLPTQDGYVQLPAGWRPPTLESIAKLVQAEFGVMPAVHLRDDAALDENSLASLPAISDATVLDTQDERFVPYVLSTREIDTGRASPLSRYSMQVGVPSRPMSNYGGSCFIFRLIDAKPAADPESLDEVRDQIIADARRLAAYQIMLEDKDAWRKRLESETLVKLEARLETTAITPPPFPRRHPGGSAPQLPGIGSNPDFVDRLFKLVGSIKLDGDDDIQGTPIADRSGVVELPAKLALALVRVEGYEPMVGSEYERMISLPYVPRMIHADLLIQSELKDPLALDQIKARLGFVSPDDEEEDGGDDDPPSASAGM